MLDIRIPIGLLFLVLGIIVGIYGITTMGNAMYSISANSNINLWSGLGMFIFGAIMLVTVKMTKKRNPEKLK